MDIKTLWKTSRPLTAAGLLMLAVLVPCVIGIFADHRLVTGMPAWLKPAKFAISTAIYTLTLAWIFTYLTEWPRLRSITGWTIGLILVVEVALIDVQAARGTSSHFNVGTPLDAMLFGIMGIGILIAWIASVAVMAALFRQTFEDQAMGWALRLGMLITVGGAATGGLMTTPTASQLTEAKRTHNLTLSGAHTVGAADGGPGLPGVGWSTQHGDLRVPHFLGLHAMQILPLFAWVVKPRKSWMIVAGCVYGMLFGLALLQAMSGLPLLGGLLV